jgi:uncharacterized protein (TIGR00730 family)
MKVKNILVYCGASSGKHIAYREAAESLGALMAEKHIRLIYGGGSIGLMGIVADSVLNNGGTVTGIIPHFLNTKEVVHKQVADMRITQSMHERKALMEKECDGIIALAGGYGTFDELFEILTWAQLGLHAKPIVLINTRNYYEHLLKQLDLMVEEGFLSAANRKMVKVAPDPETALLLIEEPVQKAEAIWLNNKQT